LRATGGRRAERGLDRIRRIRPELSPVRCKVSRDASILFTPFDLRGMRLRNRVVMAPLTRNRAMPGSDVQGALNAIYYAQRATAGLIVAEATQISPVGKGYAWTPGIYSDAQVAGWRVVTDAVHAVGGKIFLQLWHVGRFSHPALQPAGARPVGPSEIAPDNKRTFLEDGTFALVGTPRALTPDEIDATVVDFADAARNAIAAGFDGVEVHGANGYLLDQFLRDGANKRTDAYGGSIENRLRFPLAVVDAVTKAVGAHRTGIRISPTNPSTGLRDSDPERIFFPLVAELSRRELAYVHVIEGETGGKRDVQDFDFRALRREFDGPWMVNNGYTRDMALDALSSGYADLIAFGRPYIANPDLVERLRVDAPLATLDAQRLFGGGAEGYTSYPIRTPVGSA
jgi:N-ethylmaleimide reductase